MSEYIIEADKQEREALAIRRLLGINQFLHPILGSLGLSLFSWYLIDVKYRQLVKSHKGNDVDVLVGPLAWKSPEQAQAVFLDAHIRRPLWPRPTLEQIATEAHVLSGGLKWPPPLDYLIGIEVKCAYNNSLEPDKTSPDEIKAAHTSQSGIKKEIAGLLHLGFNKVALLDLIANHPMTASTDSHPWFRASAMARASAEALSQRQMHSNSSVETESVLQGRLPTDSPAGHWLIPLGSVIGADERYRGAGVPIEIRKAIDNPYLHESAVRLRREEMESSIGEILDRFPVPRSLPVVIVCDRISGRLYQYIPDDDVCLC